MNRRRKAEEAKYCACCCCCFVQLKKPGRRRQRRPAGHSTGPTERTCHHHSGLPSQPEGARFPSFSNARTRPVRQTELRRIKSEGSSGADDVVVVDAEGVGGSLHHLHNAASGPRLLADRPAVEGKAVAVSAARSGVCGLGTRADTIAFCDSGAVLSTSQDNARLSQPSSNVGASKSLVRTCVSPPCLNRLQTIGVAQRGRQEVLLDAVNVDQSAPLDAGMREGRNAAGAERLATRAPCSAVGSISPRTTRIATSLTGQGSAHCGAHKR